MYFSYEYLHIIYFILCIKWQIIIIYLKIINIVILTITANKIFNVNKIVNGF